MAKDSRNRSSDEGPSTEEATSLETVIRRRARELIDAIVEEELEAMLGAAPSAWVGILQQGYRHGTRERTLTTSLGPTTFAMPRVNGEFRRRAKTQASLPSQDAVLLLLIGLLRSGQVKMRKIDRWHEMQRATQAA